MILRGRADPRAGRSRGPRSFGLAWGWAKVGGHGRGERWTGSASARRNAAARSCWPEFATLASARACLRAPPAVLPPRPSASLPPLRAQFHVSASSVCWSSHELHLTHAHRLFVSANTDGNEDVAKHGSQTETLRNKHHCLRNTPNENALNQWVHNSSMLGVSTRCMTLCP